MTEMEAESTVARAIAELRQRLPRVPIDEFVACLMRVKTEAIKRSEVLEVMPTEDMANVGGLDLLKEWVHLRRHAFGEEAREAGVDRPRGTLLVGSPGTGKSLGAKAMAHSLGLPLVKFDINRVYGSLVGSSEARVREALKTLEAMAPLVVLVDLLLTPTARWGNKGFRKWPP
jgi:SpoVK/Ycf46/Vps4 family AAA+-type ATPase